MIHSWLEAGTKLGASKLKQQAPVNNPASQQLASMSGKFSHLGNTGAAECRQLAANSAVPRFHALRGLISHATVMTIANKTPGTTAMILPAAASAAVPAHEIEANASQNVDAFDAT